MSPITGDTASFKKAEKNSTLDWSKDGADLKGAISRISVALIKLLLDTTLKLSYNSSIN